MAKWHLLDGRPCTYGLDIKVNKQKLPPYFTLSAWGYCRLLTISIFSRPHTELKHPTMISWNDKNGAHSPDQNFGVLRYYTPDFIIKSIQNKTLDDIRKLKIKVKIRSLFLILLSGVQHGVQCLKTQNSDQMNGSLAVRLNQFIDVTSVNLYLQFGAI